MCETSKKSSNEIDPSENVPRLKVKISIDTPLFDENRKLENILYFTVESIRNLPESFPTNMNYHVSTMLPSELSVIINIIFIVSIIFYIIFVLLFLGIEFCMYRKW